MVDARAAAAAMSKLESAVTDFRQSLYSIDGSTMMGTPSADVALDPGIDKDRIADILALQEMAAAAARGTGRDDTDALLLLLTAASKIYRAGGEPEEAAPLIGILLIAFEAARGTFEPKPRRLH